MPTMLSKSRRRVLSCLSAVPKWCVAVIVAVGITAMFATDARFLYVLFVAGIIAFLIAVLAIILHALLSPFGCVESWVE